MLRVKNTDYLIIDSFQKGPKTAPSPVLRRESNCPSILLLYRAHADAHAAAPARPGEESAVGDGGRGRVRPRPRAGGPRRRLWTAARRRWVGGRVLRRRGRTALSRWVLGTVATTAGGAGGVGGAVHGRGGGGLGGLPWARRRMEMWPRARRGRLLSPTAG